MPLAERGARGLTRHERREERVAGGQLARLRDALAHLTDGGDVALGRGGGERLDVPVDSAREPAHPGGDVLPRLHRVGGHHVEDLAQPLHRRLDVVELAEVLAGVVQLEVESHALAHRGEGDPVDVVRGLESFELREDLAVRLGGGFVPGR
jgi:hypothetical protein